MLWLYHSKSTKPCMGMINTEFMVIVWGGKDNMKGRGYKGVQSPLNVL